MKLRKDDSIFTIFKGPTREKLFSAMEYQYDKDAHVDIEFLFGIAYPVNFNESQDYASSIIKTRNTRIHSIEHMNNSGYKFIVNGLMEAKMLPVFDYKLYSFNIVYNTMEQTGSIRLKKLE